MFLTAPESNIVGTGLSLTVSVNGCERVQNLSILEHDTFVRNADFTQNPTEVTLAANELGGLYPTLGIAADLSLIAKATCDDGRANTSQPVAVRFFPVERVVATGQQVVPDAFFAEGGLGGSPVTFVGCVGAASTQTGTALVRVDTNGTVTGANTQLPFPCSYNSQFTDRNLASGKRWLWERGVGAFAFDPALNITSIAFGSFVALGVGPDGDALVYDDKARPGALKRLRHAPGGGSNVVWGYDPAGLLMGNPIVEPNTQTVALPVFIDDLGAYSGTVAVERVAYASGSGVSRYDMKLINYGALNTPQIPPGVFDPSGSVLYFPYQAGTQNGIPTSAILACATNATGCANAALRWQSPNLTGLVLATLPFANSSQIAAISAQHLWFISASNGQITSFANKPIVADGALTALGAQAGVGTDFYILNGPASGYPVEIVAIDAPGSGEVYRYQMSGGLSPTTALTVAIDDAGGAWLRIGLSLVKPLPLSEYRTVRGPSKE